MHQNRPTWKDKIQRSGYFFCALIFHIILLILVATVVIFHAPPPETEAVFQAVHVTPPPPPPSPPPSAAAAAQTPMEPVAVPVPPSAPAHILNSTVNTSFQVDTTKDLATAASHLTLPAPQSTGLAAGGGNAGRGLGSTGIDFFGVHAKGNHIAFLLDYSGSMEGAFRTTMEKQLEASLKKLPDGTQVILICWAGPAWLYNQTEPQIKKDWRKLNAYDNFERLPGHTLKPPSWIDVNAGSTADIMKGIKAQVSAPGGTDWRQPFIYAMQADPPPDVIFFLTDGQIPATTITRATDAIATVFKKTGTPPQVNCLFIENRANPPGPMEALAKQYKGEFRKVSAKTAGQ